NCSYTSNISWRNATTPQAKEVNPGAVFTRMFSDVRQGRDAQQVAKEAMLRRSVLDLVTADASSLRGGLGTADQRKLDEYLEAVREVEQRIQRVAERGGAAPPPEAAALKVPEQAPEDYLERLRLMMDLVVLAFQTDSTRIATLMYDNDATGRAY